MPLVSMKKVDIISALCVIPICVYVFYESGRWPILPDLGNPAWIPRGVAAVLLGAALLLLGKALMGRSLTLPGRLEGADRARVLWVAALTGVYVVIIERLGFMTATAPYLFGFSLALGERRWSRLILFSVVGAGGHVPHLRPALNVPLPRGLFR